MSIPKITGREARNLLDGTTPGPWEARPNGVVVSYATGAQIQLVGHNQRALGDAPLMAAAPALAETVAWLYDRIREIHNDQRCWADAYRAPIEWDPHSTDPARLARAEAHDDCADMLATILDDEKAQP